MADIGKLKLLRESLGLQVSEGEKPRNRVKTEKLENAKLRGKNDKLRGKRKLNSLNSRLGVHPPLL